MGEVDDVLFRFGQRVQKVRQSRNMSQRDLADACGLEKGYIAGMERGRRNVSLMNINVIARALDVTIARLMSRV